MPEPSLVVLSGVLANREFPLASGEILVGRDSQCQIPVPDGAMSRRHFRIQRNGSKLLLTDLGSHNGTYVNSVAVKETALAHQDRIEAGQSIFLVLLGEEASSTNAARAVRGEPPSSTQTVRISVLRAGQEDASPARPARELAALWPSAMRFRISAPLRHWPSGCSKRCARRCRWAKRWWCCFATV